MRAAKTKWIRVMGLSVIVASLGAGATQLARGQAQAGQTADPPRTILLWPNGAPGAKGTDPVKDVPSLRIWLPRPDLATGAAVVVCPGGGYGGLADDHEGKQVAEWLNSVGVAAFVLKYRLGPRYHHPAMLDDAGRAIRLVRANAARWNVDPGRVAIMGFSAGGHLASTAGTHFNQAVIDNPGKVSLRPDFMILLYPVISFEDSIGHRGSRDNLIGLHPDAALVRKYSNELQVTAQTPPTFLVHAGDDKVVPVANSLHFYEALQANGVPAEMHIYPAGGHGFGMNNPTTADRWTDRLKNWLIAGKWIH
jgi:acetyl esterase/lipase